MADHPVFNGSIPIAADHTFIQPEPGKITWPNGDEVTAQELRDALVAFKIGRRVEREEFIKVAESQMEAFLPSPGLDPSWVAGWHAAVRHTVLALKRGF